MSLIRTILLLSFSIVATLALRGQRIAVVSDIHGNFPATAYVAAAVTSANPDAIVSCGDNHYGLLNSIDTQVGQYYHAFIAPYHGIFGTGSFTNRFFPALGNHDYDSNGFQNFLSFFTLPGNERYYDFVLGDFHVFALNCVQYEPDGVADTSFQAMWLKNRLMHSTQKFNIVYFHYPPYCSCNVHGSCSFMQWPFKAWGATAVFSGHNHVFEHLIIDSLNYFVCGVGGGNLYNFGQSLSGSVFKDSTNHGYILLEAHDDSLSCKFINTDDSLIYRTSIYKNTILSEIESKNENSTTNIIYNPAQQKIIFSDIRRGRISVYSLTGKEVLSMQTSNKDSFSVDVSSLSKGEYIIKVVNLQQNLSKKIIII
jgi:predicted phosphodiesterase